MAPHNAEIAPVNLPGTTDVHVEELDEDDEEEDEDIDFNPLFRADTPSEASSSLSSDNEEDLHTHSPEQQQQQQQQPPLRVTEEDEEIVMQTQQQTHVRSANGLTGEDAICKRTRARHSLANYSLEELETFLQDSDDDGEHNVDDEEVYQKFLAAVLLGGDDDDGGKSGENVDEDEENDADFELEIEEALESDVDEVADYEKEEGDACVRETRRKKRLRENNTKPVSGKGKTPLRPLLPYVPTTQKSPFPMQMHNIASYFSGANSAAGFAAHQIGQLHCLIHEHVQLLIQTFSVSVLDPSRQEVASRVQDMLLEMTNRCEDAVGSRKVPYPGFCFHNVSLHPSVQLGSNQSADCSYWTPLVDNPIVSVLDVAPLRLVKSYMADVSHAVTSYRQSHVAAVADKSHLIREPLFPLPTPASPSDKNKDNVGGNATMSSNIQPSVPLSPGQVQPRKSLAAAMIESTKRQSVALVPKDIAKSAQRFIPLFNSALFPHKPPIPAVANRCLFTDAEDGLLAMGLMEYNNDWEAIRKHFLPCKTEHQIFVRQKNRSSGKAPENPIKAVRCMKNSALTADELARISEGIKIFKRDWMAIWKFVVPYRDPSLLPRQYRTAIGVQKSYKTSEAVKEKRRLYERNRRNLKASMADYQTSSDREVDNGGDNNAGDNDGEDEAYVHEAFVADLEPRSSKRVANHTALASVSRGTMQSVHMMPYRGSFITENGRGESQQESGQGTHFFHSRYSTSCKQLPSYSTSSQARNSKGSRVVKLAPNLAPVNLPPSVRVISQSAFKSYHTELSCSVFPQSTKVGTSPLNPVEPLNKFPDNDLDTFRQQDEVTLKRQLGTEENTSESDLRMHPLLFQAPKDQSSSYFSNNCQTTVPNTCSYFPGNTLHSDPNVVGRQLLDRINVTPHSEGQCSELGTTGFHPLLQRADIVTGDAATVPSLDLSPGGLRAPQGNCDNFSDQSNCIPRVPLAGDGQVATSITSAGHNKRKNKFDLNIRLSSASDNEREDGGDVDRCQRVEATIPSWEHMMGEKALHAEMPFLNHNDKCPEALATNNSFVNPFACSQNGIPLEGVPPSNLSSCQSVGDLHDESMAGIVMEQEELSDSEEEIEHVEFEHEEIDDSEGDELGSELPNGNQNKELPFFTCDKEELQANHNLRRLQSRSLEKGSVGRDKNCISPMQVSQASCAELSIRKPKHDSAKRSMSCKSSINAPHPVRPTRKRVESSKLHPLQTVQHKAAAATRKPRKRPI